MPRATTVLLALLLVAGRKDTAHAAAASIESHAVCCESRDSARQRAEPVAHK